MFSDKENGDNKMIFATNKTLVIGCILALIVGASTVLPILLFSELQNNTWYPTDIIPNPQSVNSQIGAQISKASVWLGTMTEWSEAANSVVEVQAIRGGFNLNCTKYLNNNESIPEAEIDYFLVELSTENGTVLKSAMQGVEVTYQAHFNWHTANYSSNWNELFGTKISGMSVGGVEPWIPGTSQNITPQYFGVPLEANSPNIQILKNSQTLTMTVSRFGTVIIRGNSTDVSTVDQGLIEKVQLQKIGESFQYSIQ
jgi:hypothetical protein